MQPKQAMIDLWRLSITTCILLLARTNRQLSNAMSCPRIFFWQPKCATYMSHITKIWGAPAFSICGGCKLVRYCVSNSFNPKFGVSYRAPQSREIILPAGKPTNRSASLRRASTKTPWKVCTRPLRWLRLVSQWWRKYYISKTTSSDDICGLYVSR